MNSINNNVFPVTDEIIYSILHSLHRHRREEYLKEDLPFFEKKLKRKRKHSNSRRYDVSKKFGTL